jgi:hypothetical protein
VDDFIISPVGRIAKYDLEKMKRNLENEILYLGMDEINYEEIYLVSIDSTNTGKAKWLVVYKTMSTDISIINCGNHHVGIGFDQTFAIIDLKANQLKYSRNLDGLFIFARQFKSSLLILSELAITIIDDEYQLVLYQPSDFIISDFTVTETFIDYTTELGTQRIRMHIVSDPPPNLVEGH